MFPVYTNQDSLIHMLNIFEIQNGRNKSGDGSNIELVFACLKIVSTAIIWSHFT